MASVWTQLFLVVMAFMVSAGLTHVEKRLHKHVLDNYEKVGLGGRPQMNDTEDPTDVSLSFFLVQIQDFDQHKQVLTLTGMVKLKWTDSLLFWDPSDFGDVEHLSLDPDEVWTPDVVLYNSVSNPRNVHPARLWVTSGGEVTWVREFQWDIWCETYVEEETPSCELRFGSWSTPSSMLALKSSQDRLDANYYIQNHVYELDKTKTEEMETEFPFRRGEFHSEVKVSFSLKKRPPKVDESELDKDNAGQVVTSSHVTVAVAAAVFILLH